MAQLLPAWGYSGGISGGAWVESSGWIDEPSTVSIGRRSLDRLSLEDRRLADSLMRLALDHEALYTLLGSIKPISDVATFTFRIARPSRILAGSASVSDTASPALKQIERLQRVVNAMRFGDVEFFIHPFKRADSAKRTLQVAVLRRSAIARCIRRNQSFFGQFGFVPESEPLSVITATEYEDKYDRFRGYGYLYGYPEHAITFFVEAARSQDSTGRFVQRDFFQIPTWSGKQGHFVYAVPKGYVGREEDSLLYYAASKVLSQYRALRSQYVNADSTLRALELFQAWMQSNQGDVRADERREAFTAGNLAILWAQSAEAKALCLQAFSLAQERLAAALQSRSARAKSGKRPAVVVDIDETILDNSPFNAEAQFLQDRDWMSLWENWERKAAARALPGAVEFLQFADKRGVAVFYISNRSNAAKEETMRNLRAAGFPQVKPEQVLLKEKSGEQSGEKESRRQAVAAQYDILLLAGDNLADFDAAFEYKTPAERMEAVFKARQEWGRRFIVLPNAMYGQWEDALYSYKRLSRKEQQERHQELLRSMIVKP